MSGRERSAPTLGSMARSKNIGPVTDGRRTTVVIERGSEYCIEINAPADVAIRLSDLFAAAPDMLEALRMMLRAHEELMPGVRHIACQDYAILNDAPRAARAAIAKSTPERPA